jgi:hypothetical protein
VFDWSISNIVSLVDLTISINIASLVDWFDSLVDRAEY